MFDVWRTFHGQRGVAHHWSTLVRQNLTKPTFYIISIISTIINKPKSQAQGGVVGPAVTSMPRGMKWRGVEGEGRIGGYMYLYGSVKDERLSGGLE